jgi:uncharacterized protein (DUF1778 family)
MKMGRPKIPKADRKGKIAGVRLSPDERKTLDSAAFEEGLGLSKWMRKTLLDAAKSALDFRSKNGTLKA